MNKRTNDFCFEEIRLFISLKITILKLEKLKLGFISAFNASQCHRLCTERISEATLPVRTPRHPRRCHRGGICYLYPGREELSEGIQEADKITLSLYKFFRSSTYCKYYYGKFLTLKKHGLENTHT